MDAGYLYAGGSSSISGSPKKRAEVTLDVPTVVKYLAARAEKISGLRLLRIYWYDGAISDRLGTDHQALASSDNVKLRLGIINGFGQQKGVDAKIITDMTELARNAAYCEAVLLGGDEDLRIGVELAQERGARIHLLTIEDSSSSLTLKQEADTWSVISKSDVQSFLSIKVQPAAQESPGPSAAASAPKVPRTIAPSEVIPIAASAASAGVAVSSNAPAVQIDVEVKQYLMTLTIAEKSALKTAIQSGGLIPPEHDGRVLARAGSKLGRSLDHLETKGMRQSLKKQLGLT